MPARTNSTPWTNGREMTDEKIHRALRRAGVPGRYLQARLADFENIPEPTWDRCGYFLAGIPGIGKSHLAAAILRDRCRQDHPKTVCRNNQNLDEIEIRDDAICWISAPRFLSEIRSTFGRNGGETQEDVVTRYARFDLLVLDDLGAEKITDWSASTLYDLISRREAEPRDTVVTSNQTLDRIAEWEPRIASRLHGFGRIKLPQTDRRKL